MSELSRRDFLHTIGGGVLAAGLPVVTSIGCQTEDSRNHSVALIDRSAMELAAAIRDREVSSEEVVSAFLDRIQQVNSQINAVVLLDADHALKSTRAADRAVAQGERLGPLHGVPITIKDSYDTKGIVTTAGTPGRASYAPDKDATAVARLKAAGAIVLGKTNTPEMTWSYETNNTVYGRTNNPYDLNLTPGGSSGGAAAALASSCSPLDIGSDTGGSIRLPAHFCGIAGLKPTAGRVPRTGHIISFEGPLEGLTHVGPLARYVEDLALTLKIIAGPDGVDPYIVPVPLKDPAEVMLSELRVAYFTDNGIATPSAETISTIETAVAAVADTGARVDEAKPTGIKETLDLFITLVQRDGSAWLERILRKSGTTEGKLYESLDTTTTIPASEYSLLIERWDRFKSGMLPFWRDHDALICPVNAHAAIEHGTIRERGGIAAYSYTMTYNLTGWPSAVVRCGTTKAGLPIGVQVVAPPWQEHVSLAVAGHLEAELGGWTRAL